MRPGTHQTKLPVKRVYAGTVTQEDGRIGTRTLLVARDVRDGKVSGGASRAAAAATSCGFSARRTWASWKVHLFR